MANKLGLRRRNKMNANISYLANFIINTVAENNVTLTILSSRSLASYMMAGNIY